MYRSSINALVPNSINAGKPGQKCILFVKLKNIGCWIPSLCGQTGVICSLLLWIPAVTVDLGETYGDMKTAGWALFRVLSYDRRGTPFFPQGYYLPSLLWV